LTETLLEFTQMLPSMMELAGKETSCLYNALFCDFKDTNCFSMLEKWQTRDDLNIHISSHLFGILLGSKSLLCRPMKINYYSVSKTEGMEVVDSVRNQ